MLLDTSGLLCLHDDADERHQDTETYYDAAPKLLTHSYVLAEFVPLCQTRGFVRSDALTFLQDLMDNADVEVVWVDEQLHRAALSLLLSRPDKRWSLCDAVSFVLMEQEGVTDALTTDHHFEQAGLRPLLT